MDRHPLGAARLSLVVCLALLAVATGCNVLATAMYIVKGPNTKAEFGGLTGKRVAVICRPASTVQYSTGSVSNELARQVSVLLEKNVAHIKLIKQNEVAQWMDENSVDDVVDIGKALHADMVVAIDLEHFSMMLGQTLYQGKANISLAVYDVHKDEKEPVFGEKQLPQVVYPPNSGIPTGDTTEPQFRRNFIKLLSEQVARHFYEHDPTADFANDCTALQ